MKTGTECDYYPCHFEGNDCTFCFCPFYPCLEGSTGGKYVTSKRTGKEVWSCKKCVWIHDKAVAKSIQTRIDEIPKDDRKKLLELRMQFLE